MHGPQNVKCLGGGMPTVESIFDVLLTVHLSIFISVINQIDVQNFYSTISLLHASTWFEHVLIIRRCNEILT